MLELFAHIIIFIGTLFALIAALGLYRLEGLYQKMHAATKVGTLGCSLILLGVALQLKNIHTATEIFLLVFFIAVTNPISAHLIAKTASMNGYIED